MKDFMTKSVVALAVLSSSAMAEHNCFPENDMKIPVKRKFSFLSKSIKPTGMNEIDFHNVIDAFEDVWSPIVRKKYGKKLVITRDWKGERVNASATRDDDNNPVIIVNGGLARHSEMTRDGLLLILCHELGHHYGGAPKPFRGRSSKRSWSSAEGQADYFATSKCMPRLILEDKVFTKETPETIQTSVCKDSTCLRILPAALSVGRMFASLKRGLEVPSLEKRANGEVWSTNYKHASPQCRFDTFVAGSLCSEEYDVDFDSVDHKVGACVSYDDAFKARPKCWFAPDYY